MSDLQPESYLNNSSNNDSADRRNFVLRGAKFIAAALLGALLYPVFKFLGFKVPRKPLLVKVEKDLLPGGFHIEDKFILFKGESEAWAVSRRCTHLGCQVAFHDTEKLLICPCHQSRFSIKGERLAGPAVKNLGLYPVEKASAGQKGYVVRI